MKAGGAIFEGLFRLIDIAAVETFPPNLPLFHKDPVFRDVLQQLQIPAFVLGLHLRDHFKSNGNLGETLLKLRRLDEARMEILRAIECKSQFGHATEPWKSWTTLADIESDAGNTIAAAEATRKAIDCYLAYRRDGGENHYDDGRIALAVTQQLLAADPTTAASLLKQQIPHFGAAGFGVFIRALQAIATGSRDQTLADAPDLSHTMAAEILLLIETLVTQGL